MTDVVLVLGIGWGDLLAGVIAGVVAASLWALCSYLLRVYRVRRDFHHLEGPYTVREKLSSKFEPETTSIRVAGNVLHVTQEGFEIGGTAKGEIEMNTAFTRSGRGQYEHTWPTGEIAFGFWDVQVKDRETILVHTTFARSNTTVVKGYAWELTRQPKGARQ